MKAISVWKEYKLTITDPPNHKDHFDLIKDELIPFIDKYCLPFWITNYWNQNEDYILFRVKGDQKELSSVKSFLNGLKNKGLIVRFKPKPWDPRMDAQNRIKGLSNKIPLFDPKTHRIDNYSSNTLFTIKDPNFKERKEQLTNLFESLGECTKAIYTHLKSKPNDKWIMSLFIHLLLNSLDYSGPNYSSDEYQIRQMPVY